MQKTFVYKDIVCYYNRFLLVHIFLFSFIMAAFDILTVRELIDTSISGPDTNKVDFNRVKSVLYILARHLRLLQRHVSVSLDVARGLKAERGMSVTEVKIHSQKSKKEGKSGKAKEKSSSDKTSSGTKSSDKSGGKYSSDKTSSDTKSSDKGGEKYSTDKTSSGKQTSEKGDERYSSEKTSTGTKRPDRGGEKYSTDKTSSGSKSSDKKVKKSPAETSSTDDKTIDSDIKRGSDNIQGVTGGRKRKGQPFNEMEVIHEKLLIVSRTPSGHEIDNSVVTQEQYNTLVTRVRELQTKFGQKDLLEDASFVDDINKKFSMTDPMAVIQMSARLQAAENKLAEMMPVTLELCKTISGIDVQSAFDDTFLKEAAMGDWGPTGPSSQVPPPISRKRKSAAFKQPPPKTRKRTITQQQSTSPDYQSSSESEVDAGLTTYEAISVAAVEADIDTSVATTAVTWRDLRERFGELQDEIMKYANDVTNRSVAISNTAQKNLMKNEMKLEEAMKLGDSFTRLDFAVEDYSERVTILDTKITHKMTEYQDSLTQMQYELEIGLDALAETLASPNEDVAAIAELNGYFTAFQLDLDNTAERNREAKYCQKQHLLDLEDLMKNIKELEDIKCSREEVTDALSVKADKSNLNGMVSMEQFQAVRGDFEKRIGFAYDKFNNKETNWQKSIDETIRELNEKADNIQLLTLNEEIQKYFTVMSEAVNTMLDIVGDTDQNPNKKKLERFDNCLSCGTWAKIEADADVIELMLARPPATGAETVETEEDETPSHTRDICIPMHPIRHAIDPRSLICQHYYGAPIIPTKPSLPIFVEKLHSAEPNTEGTEGIVTDDSKKTCIPCNIKVEGNEYRCPSIASTELNVNFTWTQPQ